MAKPRLPAYMALGSIPQVLGYTGIPLAAARRDRRLGWRGGRPGRVNYVGLAAVGLGVAGLEWAILSHYRDAPDDAKVMPLPDYLVTKGAYGRSRNPLYVAGLTTWTGWALFLGSRRALAAEIACAAFLAFVGIPFEERMLQNRFGDAYERYVEGVPRWL